MKVVFATPYMPAPPNFGGARRMNELIRGARRAHDTHVISLTSPGDDVPSAEAQVGPITPVPVRFTAQTGATRSRRTAQFRSIFSTTSFQYRLYHHPAFQAALDRQIDAAGADLVQFEFSQMGSYRIQGGVPTVLDVHNIEHDVVRQMAAHGSTARRIFTMIEYRKFRIEEIAAWKTATCCIATSEADSSVIARQTGGTVPVIPNGVDVEYFQCATESPSIPGSIVFIGAMRYRPNGEAARFFVEQVLPIVRRAIPDAHVAIVGADPSSEVTRLAERPGVTVTGTVPDVRPWLRSAQIVVAPLRAGGGTRLKILEAFAMGRPVVATTIGAEGLAVEHRRHLLLANDPHDFAACVVELANDAELRARLTAGALELVRDRYQWSEIGRALNALYGELVERRSFPGRGL